MKEVLVIATVLVTFISIYSLFSQEFTFVGVAKCKICHKPKSRGRQFLIWDESKHSKSFQVLTSDEVIEMVPDAPENPKCLKCHSPLSETAPEIKEEGITCEVCHGPGSAYKSLNVMKSREESIKNGLIVYDSKEAIKKQCLSCHKNAHDKPFDFADYWEKIKHPVPEKNINLDNS